MILKEFIPVPAREENYPTVEKWGDLEVVATIDGCVHSFPSDKYQNVFQWVILEDGSAVGWNESPRDGWSFPRVGKRGIRNFYKKYKNEPPKELQGVPGVLVKSI